MFLELLNSPLKRETNIRELPVVPDTGWRPPAYFPELRDAIAIGIDCDTREKDSDHGPGWGRNAGHIIGVSVAAIWPGNRTGKWYFPVRHEVEREYNLDPEQVFAWLRVMLATPTIPKVGANLLYDYGWLASENIYPQGPINDVQFAEALIDEDAFVALDVLAKKYVGRGKTTDLCKDWIFKAFPKANNENWRGFLYMTPPRLAGPYAEDDADLPLQILPRQWSIMSQERTLALYQAECRSIPMLVRMRLGGVSVNVTYAQEMRKTLVNKIKECYEALNFQFAVKIESVSASSQLAKLFDSAGIPYPKTPTGKPSFKKEWLKALEHPVGVAVNEIRELEKLVGTFLDSYVLDRAATKTESNGQGQQIGKLYCSFHPMKDDENGAKTGRYASSNPNLQNIPSRTEIGAAVRKAFVPDYGHVRWHKKDHSQIEYRMLANFAVGRGADDIRLKYIHDPATDYHNSTALDVAEMRDDARHFLAMSAEQRDADGAWGRFRKPIKNINFGLIYGQTERSLIFKAGWTPEQGAQFFGAYHARLPFVRSTMQEIEAEVQAYGFITTLAGRRCRFKRWEATRKIDRDGRTYGYEEAIAKFGTRIRRAFAYRGVNYKFQGSAAEVLKAGMLANYEQGVYDYIGFPKLQVHDENDWSVINDSPAMKEAFRYASHVMETAMTCNVPLKVDSTDGLTWGHCK